MGHVGLLIKHTSPDAGKSDHCKVPVCQESVYPFAVHPPEQLDATPTRGPTYSRPTPEADIDTEIMPGLSPFTTVFRAHPAPDSQKVTKRNRQAISCAHCRTRKLRCDRQQPCGSCVKRGQEECIYTAVPASTGDVRKDTRLGPVGKVQPPKQEVQLRLQRLERMVQDLLAGSAEGDAPPPEDIPVSNTEAETGTEHTPHTSESEPIYHGATHWAAFLDDIREIQVVLKAEGPEGIAFSGSPAQACLQTKQDMFLGGFHPITIEGVLSSLPCRQDVDVLVGAYFAAKYTAIPFLHVRQFQREYEAFWANPRSTSFLWISILFAILATSAIILRANGSDRTRTLKDPDLPAPAFYNAKGAQCLVAGQYLENKKYAIEALLLHAHTSHVASRECDSVLWAIFGLATRLAQRSGYHRDPSALLRQGRITPFEAEMRRRVWFFVEAFDLLLSFQLGMPPIVHAAECDTLPPGNYPDDDFDEHTTIMPAPRAPLDATPTLYYAQKAILCRILRRVIQHALRVDRPTIAEARALHAELSAWRAALPPCMYLDTIRACSFADQPHTIMHRLLLELMYCKALCVLYRPYLTTGRDDKTLDDCRSVCRTAALRMLNLQFEFDTETRPGGRLYQDRWMLSSLTLHDFKVAAMVLCLDLNESGGAGAGVDRAKTIETLRTAKNIWSERAAASPDAKRASAVLRAMLQRLADGDPPEPSPSGDSAPAEGSEGWSESTLDGMGDLGWPLADVQGQDTDMWSFGLDDLASMDYGMCGLGTLSGV